MTIKQLATVSLLLAPLAFAFVGPKHGGTIFPKATLLTPMRAANDEGSPSFNMDNILAKVPELPEFSMGSLDIESIKDNLMDGNLGERGEAYAAAQFGLLLCIAIGGIPIAGDFLMVLLGPCMMLAGAAAILLSLNDLGSNLSPWVVPAKDGELVQDGIYSKLRHPQYAGLLAIFAGLSIVTGSASRLLLTAVLYYVLNQMAEIEESELTKKHPDYKKYTAAVPGKVC
jgi:protein-S-isoprenylcysteine O-methyltransferase Ste14